MFVIRNRSDQVYTNMRMVQKQCINNINQLWCNMLRLRGLFFHIYFLHVTHVKTKFFLS